MLTGTTIIGKEILIQIPLVPVEEDLNHRKTVVTIKIRSEMKPEQG